MIYDDGTSFMGLHGVEGGGSGHRQSRVQRRRYRTPSTRSPASPKPDADVAYDLLEKYRKKWRAAFHEWRYNPPTPWEVPDAFERLLLSRDAPIPREYQFYTSQQVAYDLFESDYMRTLFMRSCMTSSGVFPSDSIGVYWTLTPWASSSLGSRLPSQLEAPTQ